MSLLTRRITPLAQAINATVTVPGSKSIAARALVCSALAKGNSVVKNLPSGDDTNSMLNGLVALGASIKVFDNTVEFIQSIDTNNDASVVVDAMLAGTTARFITAVAALRVGETIVTGGDALRLRPMDDLHNALSSVGVSVMPLNGAGRLPVAISKGVQCLDHVEISGSTSSQFTSALMLIAPRLPLGLAIASHGDIVSQSYIEMTKAVQAAYGVKPVETSLASCHYAFRDYAACTFVVEPDASSASYPLAAAAIVGGSVTVLGMGVSSLQGDAKFIDILEQMGCGVVREFDRITVTRNTDEPLLGVSLDMRDMSDLVPTLSVVAACAQTTTTITGVGFIRNKESDRLGDLASELQKLGADVEVTEDGLVINPSTLHGGEVQTHHDHRLAMSLALIGLRVENVIISDPGVVSKSWPEYWEMLDGL